MTQISRFTPLAFHSVHRTRVASEKRLTGREVDHPRNAWGLDHDLYPVQRCFNVVANQRVAVFHVTITPPIFATLAETLEAGPCGDPPFIASANCHPLTKETSGKAFREACLSAGVKGSAYGVGKIAATRAANAGATVAQLEAILGWQGGTMASLYTREADRRHLALEGMRMLENEKRISIVAPKRQRKVRLSERKDK